MKTIDGKIIANKNELLALAAHASKDETRPNVNSILFDPRRGAIATDGHRVVWAQFEPGKGASFLVSLASIVGLTKQMAGEDATIGPTGASFGTTSVTWKPIEATFPAIEAVVPKTETSWAGMPAAYNAEYVAAGAKIAKAVGSDAMTVYPPESPLDPLLISIGDEKAHRWLLVIMPIRVSVPQLVALRQSKPRPSGAAAMMMPIASTPLSVAKPKPVHLGSHYVVRTYLHDLEFESKRFFYTADAQDAFRRTPKPEGGRKVLVKVTRRRIEKPAKPVVKAVPEAAE